MGFEGRTYYGAAGATGSTEFPARDVTITFDYDKGDTTERNSGTSPIETGDVTVRKWSCTFNMLNRASDSTLEAMMVAAMGGTPVALRLKDHSSGKGFDGDVILKVTNGQPLRGEQTLDFTAEPNGRSRVPSLYI